LEQKKFSDAAECFQNAIDLYADEFLKLKTRAFRSYAISREAIQNQNKILLLEKIVQLKELQKNSSLGALPSLFLGRIYRLQKNEAAAIEAFEHALERDPQSQEATDALAFIHRTTGIESDPTPIETAPVAAPVVDRTSLKKVLALSLILYAILGINLYFFLPRQEIQREVQERQTITDLLPVLGFETVREHARILSTSEWIAELPDPKIKSFCESLHTRLSPMGVRETLILDENQESWIYCSPTEAKRRLLSAKEPE
jgi:tetratricopeptide (TPR) repeat protein